MSKFRLDGKVALVTGGASGIGGAISHALAEQGRRWRCTTSTAPRAPEIVVAAIKIGRRPSRRHPGGPQQAGRG